MFRSAGRFLAALCAASIMVLGVFASAASAADYSAPGGAFDVLPPGQGGSFSFTPNSSDQIPLYDGLTPKRGNVTAGDLPNFFKQNVFGLGNLAVQGTRTFPARPGLTITRDTFSVPHITANNRDDVMFGVGFATSEDRMLLMDTLRYPGRAAVIDAPGLNPFALAQGFQPFNTSQQTEDFVAQQVPLIQSMPGGQRLIDDFDNYIAGINEYRAQAGTTGPPWNRNDVISVAALIGAVFGKGGGDEARRSQLLSALQDRLGKHKGEQVWRDLREENDPETATTLDKRFRFTKPNPNGKGNAVVDAGSLDASAEQASAENQREQKPASNAMLVGKDKSATGHPYFVAGPQVGYYYPQILYEVDVHGGGIDARGVSFPGSAPYVEIGRGPDYSWSATSSGSDNIDIFVETLCGDDTHYKFDGQCRAMTTFDAGTVGFVGTPVIFNETVHGPVLGYATVHGERVALSSSRSTRNREAVSGFGFAHLNDGTVHSVDSFYDAANEIEFSFNWFYADKDDVAMFSSGRLPDRHPQVDIGLPTIGTGKYEWRGFLSKNEHPHGTAPRDDTLVNWNNKQAPGWQAADDEWGYGSVVRNELLEAAANGPDTHTLASTVGAMNYAATQDLRNAQAFRGIDAMLRTGGAPSARAQQMYQLLLDWRAQGSSRLDADLNGTIDDPGAAIMDHAWPKFADAVMGPVLGPQLGDLASIMSRDNKANNQGSSYGSGWYGYVEKDLRRLAGQGHVEGKFKTKFCGAGDFLTCRTALWAALEAAGTELEDEFANPDPNVWRSDASTERIFFSPGFLPFTMRWTNRPTFQQAITYDSHRP